MNGRPWGKVVADLRTVCGFEMIAPDNLSPLMDDAADLIDTLAALVSDLRSNRCLDCEDPHRGRHDPTCPHARAKAIGL